jgi:hypothetical protein
MKIKSYIKAQLALKQMTMSDLACEMSKLSNKSYTRDSLNGKFYRETLSVKELDLISEILGFTIEYKCL